MRYISTSLIFILCISTSIAQVNIDISAGGAGLLETYGVNGTRNIRIGINGANRGGLFM